MNRNTEELDVFQFQEKGSNENESTKSESHTIKVFDEISTLNKTLKITQEKKKTKNQRATSKQTTWRVVKEMAWPSVQLKLISWTVTAVSFPWKAEENCKLWTFYLSPVKVGEPVVN